MNITHLNYFIEVANSGSLTKAASKLYISQSALSQAMQKLEDELDMQLLIRDKSGIKLTAGGELVLEYALNISEQSDKLKWALKNSAHDSATLRLWTFAPPTYRFIIPMFKYYTQGVKVLTTCATYNLLDEALRNDEADITVSEYPSSDPDITSVPFAREELQISVPLTNKLAIKDSISYRDLGGEIILEPTGLNVIAMEIVRQIRKEDIAVNFVSSDSDYMRYRETIKKTNMLSFMSRTTVYYISGTVIHEEIYKGRKSVFISDPQGSKTYYISFLRSQQKRFIPLLNWLPQ